MVMGCFQWDAVDDTVGDAVDIRWNYGIRHWGPFAYPKMVYPRVICVLTLSVIFGIFGNRWAWKYKKWKSVQHFEFVQKNWKQAGFIIVIGPFLLGIILLIVLLVIHGF